MLCQVKLYIPSIPGPMQQYYADTIDNVYVYLTVTQALADAFTEDLTGTQTCQWLEYWASQLKLDAELQTMFKQTSLALPST